MHKWHKHDPCKRHKKHGKKHEPPRHHCKKHHHRAGWPGHHGHGRP